MTTILIVPGLFNSEPEHWQSWLERRIACSVRVNQDDWTVPDLARWTARVREQIDRSSSPVFLVAHSFGCLASVKAAADPGRRVAGAMLVAPPDPDHWNIGAVLPRRSLGFPAVVVASTNDHWMSFERTARWADRWGAELANLGEAGHISTESGFGPWPQGLSIFDRLRHATANDAASTVPNGSL